jgi:hypothetical protein
MPEIRNDGVRISYDLVGRDDAATIAATIPHGQRLRLPGLGHEGTCNASAISLPTARAFLDGWLTARGFQRHSRTLAHAYVTSPGVRVSLHHQAIRAHQRLGWSRMTHHLVPTSKVDREAAERAVARGWPEVEPILPEPLEWLQDGNWPVAHIRSHFLAAIGDPLGPYLRPILNGDDEVWKYWIISAVLGSAPLSLVRQFRADLERLMVNATAGERQEELSEVSARVLARLKGGE